MTENNVVNQFLAVGNGGQVVQNVNGQPVWFGVFRVDPRTIVIPRPHAPPPPPNRFFTPPPVRQSEN